MQYESKIGKELLGFAVFLYFLASLQTAWFGRIF